MSNELFFPQCGTLKKPEHKQKPKGNDCLVPSITNFHPAVKNFKQINIDGSLEPDTQSALAENNFCKTFDHP